MSPLKKQILRLKVGNYCTKSTIDQLPTSSIVVILDAVAGLECGEGILNDLRQKRVQVGFVDAFQAVIGGVLKHAPEEVGPGQVVEGVLSRLNRSRYNFSVQVVG